MYVPILANTHIFTLRFTFDWFGFCFVAPTLRILHVLRTTGRSKKKNGRSDKSPMRSSMMTYSRSVLVLMPCSTKSFTVSIKQRETIALFSVSEIYVWKYTYVRIVPVFERQACDWINTLALKNKSNQSKVKHNMNRCAADTLLDLSFKRTYDCVMLAGSPFSLPSLWRLVCAAKEKQINRMWNATPGAREEGEGNRLWTHTDETPRH